MQTYHCYQRASTSQFGLSCKDYPDEVDPDLQAEYRAIVGSLMYWFRLTKPNLELALTIWSRDLHKPGVERLQAAKHT
jgi:hypothetical protein